MPAQCSPASVDANPAAALGVRSPCEGRRCPARHRLERPRRRTSTAWRRRSSPPRRRAAPTWSCSGDVLHRVRRRRRRHRRARGGRVGAVPRRPGRRARRLGLRHPAPRSPPMPKTRRPVQQLRVRRTRRHGPPLPQDPLVHLRRRAQALPRRGRADHVHHRRRAGHPAGLLRPALRRRVLAARRRHRCLHRHRQLAGAPAAALAVVAAGTGDREPRLRCRVQPSRFRRWARLRRRQPGRRSRSASCWRLRRATRRRSWRRSTPNASPTCGGGSVSSTTAADAPSYAPRRGTRRLRSCSRPLRRDAVPPVRAQRAQAARRVARVVAQLRPRPAVRHAAGDRPSCLRPRHHPLRSGQQLRPALRCGGGQLRPDARRRPRPVPRRAGDLDEGRLRHVARTVR